MIEKPENWHSTSHKSIIKVSEENMEQIKNIDLFKTYNEIPVSVWEKVMDYAIKKTEQNVKEFDGYYPSPASINNIYQKIKNVEWTSSFFNGMLWQSYFYTKNELFKKAAEKTLDDYENRLNNRINTNTHDLGFLYILSSKAEYLASKNERAKDITLHAADLLMERYSEKARIIQAWGDLEDPNQKGRIIIDCLMNVPLLFWASKVTGNNRYRKAAENHIMQTRKNIIRDDDTTFHTFYFDTETGEAKKGVTNQGYSDDSCWARGQAWGIYGLSLAYKYMKDPSLLYDAKRLANHFINNLPEDLVCFWDLIFTSGEEERDSSAAAIAVCGLIELAENLPLSDPLKRIYENIALKILLSLTRNYTSENDEFSNGILLHAVYGKPNNAGIDECNIWGDYFYMEALNKVISNTPSLW